MTNVPERQSAVSPVIGTVMLVAIIVVLIAIIGAVVIGFANAEDGKKVGLSAQPIKTGGASAQLILYGGDSLSDLVKLEMIDQSSAHGQYVEVWNIHSHGSVSVGMPYHAEDVARSSEPKQVYDTIINVKGTFTDGKEVVLLVQPMTFGNVEGSGEYGIIEPDKVTISLTNTFPKSGGLTIRYTWSGLGKDVEPGKIYYREHGTSH